MCIRDSVYTEPTLSVLLGYDGARVSMADASEVMKSLETVLQWLLSSQSLSRTVGDVPVFVSPMARQLSTMEPHVTYWCETLSGDLPVLELQTDHPRPAVLTTNSSSVVLTVDNSVTTLLEGVCARYGVTTVSYTHLTLPTICSV